MKKMAIHWLTVALTTVITFTILLALVRWIGETQISQATYFNWVAGACMGNIAANMITSEGASGVITGAIQLFFFSCITILASTLSLKSRWFRRVASGEPVILIHRGEYNLKHMKKSKIDLDLLRQLLREQGYFDYRQIEYAILEPTGSLSVLPMPDAVNKSETSTAQTKNPQTAQREELNHTH
ncbi:DUF421 domain-containing protein [Alicyclobacillus acidiphilus]|uniref:DUF421 domain-containing protein n=1 Tax=Alicyclobacillus acidiphilus TaxID=182455 RepID=UPI000833CBD8|nr:YetF domain-containing protein [Alicyclobacillus acidiphilus]